jgi:hypothetical protein
MRMAQIASVALVSMLSGCSSPPSGPPAGEGGGQRTGGQAGTSVEPRVDGGQAGAGGNSDGVGVEAGTGSGMGGSAGSGSPDGSVPAPADAPSVPDGGSAVDGDSVPPAPTVPGQGPTALGRIVYSQDFEQGMAGMTRSPTNLPEDRMQIVDDPLNQRGKVVRAVYQAGDNFRTSGGTQPRSWLSNASGYQITVGTKISLAWGTMWPELETNAFFAQTIGPGPVWELRFLADGRFNVLCNKCGRNSYHMVPRQPNRWHDFRVDMDWRNGGTVQFYVDGQMVHQATLSGADASCHWDGGIYWATDAPSRPTRTVYLSNLSVGVRDQ